MDYFSRGFKSVLGGQGETSNTPSSAETIERLCDRITSATLLEDRRDAVRAIKSLSKKYRLDVGTMAMTLLVGVLQKDRPDFLHLTVPTNRQISVNERHFLLQRLEALRAKIMLNQRQIYDERLYWSLAALKKTVGGFALRRNDAEICGLSLEALINVLSADEENAETPNVADAELALQFTEIFLKEAENVSTLLGLLEEYDFRVRWPTVKLLTMLLNNRAIQIQQCVLVSPLGVSRLMDLLSDSREVIRNDGLLLLIQLTKGNAAIQKIVAFENAFDRLLEVISEEGYSDGGIVVEDCLSLMSNLFNASNINFFREGSYIQRLAPFFDFTEYTKEGRSWNEGKVKNVLMMLKLVRLLVSPSNPPQSTQSSQKIIHNCNLLKVLCDILMTTGIPAEILTETVNTVAEIIRGNQTNQGFFSVVNAPYTPPKPAIVVLLMSMISDKQPFLLRCAVLYCFQCYLYKNATGQSRIISTLLPSSAEASNVTAGQLLCGGLFSADAFSNWCAATALSHTLLGNKELKEQLLRVQLATGIDSQPVSLLQQCSNILSNLLACVEQPCESYETIIQGLSAMLIGVCIVYNNNEVEAFTAEAIKQLITTRLDPEHFLSKINEVSKTECFTAAAKHTQIQETEEAKVLIDHEFTKQFKKLEVSVSRAFLDDDENDDKQKTIQTNDAVVTQYKELIREQDEELTKLREQCRQIQQSHDQAQIQLERQAIDMVDLRNQLTSNSYTSNQQSDYTVQNMQSQINTLYEQLRSKDFEIANLRNQSQLSGISLSTPQQTTSEEEVGALRMEVASLKNAVESYKNENENLKKNLSNTENKLKVTEASLEVITANNSLREDTRQDLTRNEMVEFEELKLKVMQLQHENEQLKSQTQGNGSLSGDDDMETQLRLELQKKTDDYDQQKQDYEDLLVLLEDQDTRIKKLKARLRALGETIADESTDEDDEIDDIPNASENPNEFPKSTGETTNVRGAQNGEQVTVALG